ncbi:N-acetylmuramoyl-L-alanine amidase family protein [Lysinibacillus louembei]|uniref:N-acetylmuramoyl-L-alanine amidase n=1 Tax=Lysinibacillus louembei TaxID=1470088 RepID=A0ABZ0RU61_9BACI|nr:N-acetylmuramoyl-L-alanine amidase family protein [Lysinibacillus louembei]WPK10609.1 N-acetylmuramoyl-L-alanine amidase family protein [Lysinibacillus louembei]
MSYLFKQSLLPASKYVMKAPFTMVAEYITVHNTANDASAANEVAYHNRNDNQISFHIAIDDKEVIQCIPFHRNAWHCGDGQGAGNRKSIGVEICYSKSGGARYEAAEENAVQYIASLLQQFGWGVDRIKKHQDWSGKYCPHRILEEKRWDSFKERIQKALDKEKKMDLLTPNGRAEIRALLKKAREKNIINKAIHTDKAIEQYDDIQLLSYQAAVMNRVF